MKYNSFLKSPKKEEQEVPDTVVPQLSNIKEESYGNGEIDVVDELEGIFGIEHDEMLSNDNMYSQLGWDFMDLEEYPAAEDEEGSEMVKFGDSRSSFFEFEESHYSIGKVIKEESIGFGDGDGDGDEKGVSLNLNLNLNYQEVLEAWSDRGPLLADDHSLSTASNGHYVSTQQTHYSFPFFFTLFLLNCILKMENLSLPAYSVAMISSLETVVCEWLLV
ncbi:PREDICTED: uncharacterized protein LOC105125917 isoform X2 [Populus euphratica]|uniref:Uncharacterized protein LOC105125917 isoform X2 n=1 Tax=Populus euphratica TaxID=75702 RepID=A0AAJ6XNC6_POPEU|nr:PREDICTED: uncharacterized protein LOC105125917 isoform X2 [Populus euphratica]